MYMLRANKRFKYLFEDRLSSGDCLIGCSFEDLWKSKESFYFIKNEI